MATQAASSSGLVQLDLNLTQLCEEKTRIRTQLWDPAFQENYKAFAVELATFIARQAIAKLNEFTPHPSKRYATEEKPCDHSYKLNFTETEVAVNMVAHLKDGKELPPFKEWLNEFAVPLNKETAEEEYVSSRRKVFAPFTDRKYFHAAISIIGRCVKSTIESMLSQSAQRPENRNLRFSVTWNNGLDEPSESKMGALIHKTTSISTFPDREILVKMWIEGSERSLVDEASFNIFNWKREMFCKIGILICLIAIVILFVNKVSPPKV